ncbi:unnamed protein product [Clavelina lepadiformis]|uniref:Uncharacterized protein n=1 Tax=Clavelina lepadiformis TaxID=159417 RepID=A0ABP0GA15_CLALP
MASTDGKHAAENEEEVSSPPEESSLDKLKRLVGFLKVKLAEGDVDNADFLSAFQQVLLLKVSNQRDNCHEVFKDIIRVTHSLRERLEFNMSLFMVCFASTVCMTFSDPDIKIIKLNDCGHSANITVEHMRLLHKKSDIERHGIPTMRHLCNMLKPIETPSVALKAHILCKFLNHIGWCYFYINKYKDAAEHYSVALETITFDVDNAGEFFITGACCYQTGESYRLLQKYNDAAELFERAIEMYEEAQDVEEEEKKKCIDLSRDKLEKCRVREFLL